MEKLQWKVKHKIDFSQEDNFLETILETVGVTDVEKFLHPNQSFEYNPFLLDNMDKAVQLLHDNLDKKIFIKVDCDVDGQTSASVLKQFIQKLDETTQIDYRLDFNKRHGVFYEDVAQYKKGELGLIIIPDASIEVAEIKRIKENLGDVPILILDHHEVEEKNTDMLKYTTTVNCMLGEYPNKCLSGVGVVYKFCLAYCRTYEIPETVAEYYLDLVALGLICDSMSMISLENRYYVFEGLKEENRHNELLKEIILHNPDEFTFGLTMINTGWNIGPLINGVIRYGKPEEQIDLFRAISGEKEDREYQPRRKCKTDPKPPIEIHSLQKTMARVCGNVKQRQDTEVRKFMGKLDEVIHEKHLDNNSVIVVDGSEVLTKATVTGLVANKLATKYQRPIVILKSYTEDSFGGSGRNYGKGNLEDFKEFLGKLDIFDKLAG